MKALVVVCVVGLSFSLLSAPVSVVSTRGSNLLSPPPPLLSPSHTHLAQSTGDATPDRTHTHTDRTEETRTEGGGGVGYN